MKTLAGMIHGLSDNLLLEAANICLKKRRVPLLVKCEMLLCNLYLGNMPYSSQSGSMIMPPMLTSYNQLQTIEGSIHHLTGKILMQFGLDFRVWRKRQVNENPKGNRRPLVLQV
jgi:4-hydroxy-3-polyprenylbenzoate decarboxylase